MVKSNEPKQVEYKGHIVTKKGKYWRCPFKCDTPGYPSRKWKTLKGFLNHKRCTGSPGNGPDKDGGVIQFMGMQAINHEGNIKSNGRKLKDISKIVRCPHCFFATPIICRDERLRPDRAHYDTWKIEKYKEEGINHSRAVLVECPDCNKCFYYVLGIDIPKEA
jgi:hypothetical protein